MSNLETEQDTTDGGRDATGSQQTSNGLFDLAKHLIERVNDPFVLILLALFTVVLVVGGFVLLSLLAGGVTLVPAIGVVVGALAVSLAIAVWRANRQERTTADERPRAGGQIGGQILVALLSIISTGIGLATYAAYALPPWVNARAKSMPVENLMPRGSTETGPPQYLTLALLCPTPEARGFPPRFVAPEAIASYHPRFSDDGRQDLVVGYQVAAGADDGSEITEAGLTSVAFTIAAPAGYRLAAGIDDELDFDLTPRLGHIIQAGQQADGNLRVTLGCVSPGFGDPPSRAVAQLRINVEDDGPAGRVVRVFERCRRATGEPPRMRAAILAQCWNAALGSEEMSAWEDVSLGARERAEVALARTAAAHLYDFPRRSMRCARMIEHAGQRTVEHLLWPERRNGRRLSLQQYLRAPSGRVTAHLNEEFYDAAELRFNCEGLAQDEVIVAQLSGVPSLPLASADNAMREAIRAASQAR